MSIAVRTKRFLFLTLLFFCWKNAWSQSQWDVVAHTEETAPGADRPFLSFDAPVLNDRGDVLFSASVTQLDESGEPVPCSRGGPDCFRSVRGAWQSLAGGPLRPLVVPGQQVPAGNGIVGNAYAATMNSSGDAAVTVVFDDGKGQGIYLSEGNALRPVVLSGGINEGTGLVYGTSMGSWYLNDVGEHLFSARASDPSTGAFRNRFWVESNGDIVPGPPVNDSAGLSRQGSFGFIQIVNAPFEFGAFIGDLHSQPLRLRTGALAPGTNTEFGHFFRPSVNDIGGFALAANLGTITEHEGTGIWVGDATSVDRLVVEGDRAPGTDAVFDDLSVQPSIRNSGDVAFTAILAGEGIDFQNRLGLWKGGSGAVEKVARQGEPAPETEASFGRLPLHASDQPIWEPDSFAMNNKGQVAFISELVGPGVTPETDAGLWGETISGDLQLIVREGDWVQVRPGDSRRVANFTFRYGAGMQENYDGGFTDNGYLALKMTFTDGSSAIVINDQLVVPEPASGVYILWAGLLLVFVHLRNRRYGVADSV